MKATSPYDAVLLRSGVVILLALALALALGNSSLFAQIDNQKNLSKKIQNPIARTVRSITNQPSSVSGVGSEFGPGDGNPALFASPAMLDSVNLGVGSMCTLPTAKDSMFGGGPALFVLSMQGPWVFGALVNNQKFFADSNEINAITTMVQPIIHYNLPGGWYVNMVPTSPGEMCCGKHLIVPLGPCIGKVHCFGELPVNLQLGAYYNSEKPQDNPSWQLLFRLQFQFPQ